jgi:hypothetical protein
MQDEEGEFEMVEDEKINVQSSVTHSEHALFVAN